MTYTVATVADMEALTASASDICNVTDTATWYTYNGASWDFWYQERPSLAFQGITLEQTDDYQMAFQGITLEMEPFAFDPLMLGII